MHKPGWTVALVVAALLPGLARGDVFVAPDLIEVTETSVYRWNLNSPNDVYVRNTGTRLFGDMTRLKDGRIVAYRTTYGGATPALFQIDPNTGIASLLVQSSSGAGEIVALAPLPNGNLLGCDNSLGFVSINPATLAYTVVPLIASNNATFLNTGGMASSADGEIYAWCSGIAPGEGIFSKLFRIDPGAGTAQAIGGYAGLSASQNFNAMSFTPDGRLFGFTEINGGSMAGRFNPMASTRSTSRPESPRSLPSGPSWRMHAASCFFRNRACR